MTAKPGWIDTARRVLPKFFRLSTRTAPTWRRDSVASIRPGELASEGVDVVLWDVDGTLMAHHEREVDPALREAFDALVAAPGFRHAIVSNCQLPRLRELGEIFPDIPVLLGFTTPDGPAFRVRLHGEELRFGPGRDRLPPPGSDRVGDGVSPMRKPAGELIEAALAQLDVPDGSRRAVMVGDQYFTDIVSANLAGVRSIKVPTLDRSSFPMPVRLSQRLEAAWVGLLRVLGATRGHV